MKNIIYLSAFLFALLFIGACGGDQSDSVSDKMEEAKEAMESETNDQAANLNDAMKQAKKAMEEAGMGQKGEPVNFRELKKLLPEEMDGMEITDQSGQTSGAMGFNISQAEVEFTGGDGEKIKISIFDTGGITMATMGLAAWANVTIDKEDSNGYERTTTINGFKAFEKFDTKRKRGEISIFAKERFIVKVEGREVDMEDLRDALSDIDIEDLADSI